MAWVKSDCGRFVDVFPANWWEGPIGQVDLYPELELELELELEFGSPEAWERPLPPWEVEPGFPF